MKKMTNRFEINEFTLNDFINLKKGRIKLIISVLLNYIKWRIQSSTFINNDTN